MKQHQHLIDDEDRLHMSRKGGRGIARIKNSAEASLVSNGSLGDCNSPQFIKPLLSILSDLNYAAVWMISNRSLISTPTAPVSMTVLIAPNIIGKTDSFMFYSFFSSLAKFRYFSLFLLSFSFAPCSTRIAKSTIGKFSIFVNFI